MLYAFYSFLFIEIPLKLLLLILIAKISATKRYNNAEMGHPYRIHIDISQSIIFHRKHSIYIKNFNPFDKLVSYIPIS